jgi:hypothetical protein
VEQPAGAAANEMGPTARPGSEGQSGFEEVTVNLVMGLIMAGTGLFSVYGGLSGSEWYMSFRNSRWVRDVLGHTGACVFYVLFGLACLVDFLFHGLDPVGLTRNPAMQLAKYLSAVALTQEPSPCTASTVCTPIAWSARPAP